MRTFDEFMLEQAICEGMGQDFMNFAKNPFGHRSEDMGKSEVEMKRTQEFRRSGQYKQQQQKAKQLITMINNAQNNLQRTSGDTRMNTAYQKAQEIESMFGGNIPSSVFGGSDLNNYLAMGRGKFDPKALMQIMLQPPASPATPPM